jgi:hypothetical protein
MGVASPTLAMMLAPSLATGDVSAMALLLTIPDSPFPIPGFS